MVHSSTALAIHSHMILICDFYTFKLVPTDCVFKHDVNCMRERLPFEIFIDLRKHLIIYTVVIPKSFRQMTGKGWKNKYWGYNNRDFGQLLTSLHLQLQHFTREQENVNKNLNSISLFAIFNKICRQYVCIYIYIYIYM